MLSIQMYNSNLHDPQDRGSCTENELVDLIFLRGFQQEGSIFCENLALE